MISSCDHLFRTMLKIVEFVMLMKTVEIWLKIWKLINVLVTFIYVLANTHKLFKDLYLFRVLM